MSISMNNNPWLESLTRKMDPLRLGVWGVLLMLTSLLIWAWQAELDEVAVAIGEVVPQEQLKVIQHLEGGVIESIHVREGDFVSRGSVLLKLNLGMLGTTREEKQTELDSLLLTRERLNAEFAGVRPEYETALAERYAKLIDAEMATYEGRRNRLEKASEVARKQVEQKRLQVDELNAKLAASKNDAMIKAEELKISEGLLDEGLVSRVEYLKVKQEYGKLRGEISVLDKAIPRARAALLQSEAEMESVFQQSQLGVSEELVKIEQRIAQAKETLSKMEEQVHRADIKSPIDGIVKKMRHTTVGGVVRPGEAILEIVPQSGELVVEAKLNPIDRGYVRAGQAAMVKVTTYDFSRYGGLAGVVERIGADSQTDTSSGSSYFKVVIKTNKNYLGDNPRALRITPGMETVVDIHTGTRTVLDFLLKPFVKIKNEAFRER